MGLAPFAGGGDIRPMAFESGKVVRIGEDAIEGDIADVTVLFLLHISKDSHCTVPNIPLS